MPFWTPHDFPGYSDCHSSCGTSSAAGIAWCYGKMCSKSAQRLRHFFCCGYILMLWQNVFKISRAAPFNIFSWGRAFKFSPTNQTTPRSNSRYEQQPKNIPYYTDLTLSHFNPADTDTLFFTSSIDVSMQHLHDCPKQFDAFHSVYTYKQ